jgi:DNA-binding response OmpR family regulator
MKILIADDDKSVRTGVAQVLQAEGYACCYASDGLDVLAKLPAEKPDLLILDIMMPGMNGFDVCSTIREKEETRDLPVLMLSAKGDFVDKSVGFRFGASDYLVKPFEAEELCMHVRALLKNAKTARKEERPASGGPEAEGVIRAGDLEIYLNRYEVRRRGEKIPLTSKEFEILSFMASAPGDVFTREEILSFLWGQDSLQKDLTTVTVFIRKIREKIEDDPSNPRYIQTVWRVGYKFCRECCY